MDYFTRLGNHVASSYGSVDRDPDRFVEIAMDALRDLPPHGHTSSTALRDAVLRARELPPQLDPQSQFGQPPVTLYGDEHFVIDVYYWWECRMDIHSHAFSGAFCVLQGSSLEYTYTFSEESSDGRVLLGHLVGHEGRYLRTGDIRPIAPHPELIHQVIHLDRPTVSLVIRTRTSPDNVQMNYWPPGIGLSQHIPEAVRRKIQLLSQLKRAGDPDVETLVARTLRETDDAQSFAHLLNETRQLLDGDRDKLRSLLGVLRIHHPRLVPALVRCFVERARLVDPWHRQEADGSDSEQRFLLALLVHPLGAPGMRELAAQRFNVDDPCDHVMALVSKLAATTGFALSPTQFAALERSLRADNDASVSEESDDFEQLRTSMFANMLLHPDAA